MGAPHPVDRRGPRPRCAPPRRETAACSVSLQGPTNSKTISKRPARVQRSVAPARWNICHAIPTRRHSHGAGRGARARVGGRGRTRGTLLNEYGRRSARHLLLALIEAGRAHDKPSAVQPACDVQSGSGRPLARRPDGPARRSFTLASSTAPLARCWRRCRRAAPACCRGSPRRATFAGRVATVAVSAGDAARCRWPSPPRAPVRWPSRFPTSEPCPEAPGLDRCCERRAAAAVAPRAAALMNLAALLRAAPAIRSPLRRAGERRALVLPQVLGRDRLADQLLDRAELVDLVAARRAPPLRRWRRRAPCGRCGGRSSPARRAGRTARRGSRRPRRCRGRRCRSPPGSAPGRCGTPAGRARAGSGSCCRGWRWRRRRPGSSCFATRSAPCLVRVKTSARPTPSPRSSSASSAALAALLDEERPLRHPLDRGGDGRHLDPRGIVQHLGGEPADLAPAWWPRRTGSAAAVGRAGDDPADRRAGSPCPASGRPRRAPASRRGRGGRCRSPMWSMQAARRGDEHVDAAGERPALRPVRRRRRTPRRRTGPGACRRSRSCRRSACDSSRVGDSTRTRQPPRGGRPPLAARRCRIGSAKAAVLPVPVWAMPSRSRPSSTAGMAWAWIGVGVV